MVENMYQTPYPNSETTDPSLRQDTVPPAGGMTPAPQTSAPRTAVPLTQNQMINNNNMALMQELQSPRFDGTIQRILSENLGEYVIIEFLIGSNNLVSREGILYSVGINYVVLYDEKNEQYTICDLYPIKFVTYLHTRRSVRPTVSRNIRR